jgi:IK cytokine
MDHTHLVKGLDFALLQKVRSEIEQRENDSEEESEEEQEDESMEKEKEDRAGREDRAEGDDGGIKNRRERRKEARDAKTRFGSAASEKAEKREEKEKEKEKAKKVVDVEEESEEKKEEVACRTVLGKNIMRTIIKPEVAKVNELFLAGRMAYVMDLDEEVETDIPTTTIRSKQDIINNEQKATLSTNDIVVNKLTQILSYLRPGPLKHVRAREPKIGHRRGPAIL